MRSSVFWRGLWTRCCKTFFSVLSVKMESLLQVLHEHDILVTKVAHDCIHCRLWGLDYMDDGARKLFSDLAHDFYRAVGKSVYFDCVKGRMTVHY